VLLSSSPDPMPSNSPRPQGAEAGPTVPPSNSPCRAPHCHGRVATAHHDATAMPMPHAHASVRLRPPTGGQDRGMQVLKPCCHRLVSGGVSGVSEGGTASCAMRHASPCVMRQRHACREMCVNILGLEILDNVAMRAMQTHSAHSASCVQRRLLYVATSCRV
jgi:hypothetical protein